MSRGSLRICFLLTLALACAGGRPALAQRTTLPVQTGIDRLVNQRLAKLSVRPADECTDAEFLRRTTLDATGMLPTMEELEAFLADSSSDKRARKLEALLASKNYAWRWASWLAILSGCDELDLAYATKYTGVLPEQLGYLWLDWLRVRMERDEPYDAIVAGMILGDSREGRTYQAFDEEERTIRERMSKDHNDGGLYAQRATNDIFWRRYSALLEKHDEAQRLSRRFLGVSLDCARCHDDPSGRWTQADNHGFCAIFQRVGYRSKPIEHREKVALLSKAALVGIIGLGVLALSTILLWRRNWMKLAAAGISLVGASIAAAIYVTLSDWHYLRAGVGEKPAGPARTTLHFLDEHSLSIGTGIATLAVVVLVSLLCVMKACRLRGRPQTKALGLTASMGIAVFAGLLLVDVCFVRASFPGAERTSLVHWIQKSVLPAQSEWDRPGRYWEVFTQDADFEQIGIERQLDGSPIATSHEVDARPALVHWLRGSGSRLLARNIVNRIWAEYFGNGFVEPLDDIDGKLGQYPELLEWLVEDFVSHGSSLRHLHKVILGSATYQQSAKRADQDSLPEHSFARFVPRRLRVEQFVQAVDTLTSVPSDYGPSLKLKPETVFQMPLLRPSGQTFAARSFVLNVREQYRASETRREAACFNLFGQELLDKIRDPKGRLAQLLRDRANPESILQELYQIAYSRKPTTDERVLVQKYIQKESDSQRAWVDIVWAIVNSREFQFNH